MSHIHLDLLEHGQHHRLLLHEERGKKVERGDLVVAALDRELVRAVDGFFCFGRIVVEWGHGIEIGLLLWTVYTKNPLYSNERIVQDMVQAKPLHPFIFRVLRRTDLF